MRPASPLPPLGLGAAAGLLAGVALAQGLPALPAALPTLAVGFAGLALWWRRPGLWRVVGAGAVGLAWACLVGGWRMEARVPEADAGRAVELVGRVEGLPRRDADSLRFDLRVSEDAPPGLQGRLVRLAWHGPAPPLAAGSRWALRARLKRPRGQANPGGDDVERRHLALDIVATGTVLSPASAQALGDPRGVDAWRERMAGRIDAALPGAGGRIIRALAIGDTRGFDDADWRRLRNTGLTHLVAISGFHVGLVAGFGALCARLAWWLLPGLGRWLPRPQAAAAAALLAAAAYTVIAGMALPTVRTLLMIGAIAVARLLRRLPATAEAFALALIVMLLADPVSVLSPGFWLSFLGVGWLLWCLPGAAATPWRGLLQAQGVAALGLLPLSGWLFGQVALAGPLANLVAVPVVSMVVVPLCLAGAALESLVDGAGTLAWRLAAAIVDPGWRALGLLDAWPLAQAWLPETGFAALALAGVGAFWLLLPGRVPGKGLAIALFLPLAWPAPQSPAAGAVDVEVFDVGPGSAVLVRTAGHALLYDAGPAGPHRADLGEAVVVPALRARGIRRLDALVLSHDDGDHAGGLGAVLAAYEDTRVLAPEGWARPGMGLCRAGQRWRWDGVDFEVLHPPPLFPYMGNDSSCVLRIAAGDSVALLAGDIGRQVESRLVRIHGRRLRAQLLLAPHHGSGGASSEGFVAAVAPRAVVFSAGWRNRFGHPAPGVLARYRDAGAEPLLTAATGALRFRLDARGLRLLEARRRDRPRYWRDRGDASGYAIGHDRSDR
jgi:competence protein ComEC